MESARHRLTLPSPLWGRERDVGGDARPARLWHVLLESNDAEAAGEALYHAACGVSLRIGLSETRARLEDLPEFFPACLGCIGSFRPPSG